jgi:flagellar biosynthesis/type III secretory pathway protein FliH
MTAKEYIKRYAQAPNYAKVAQLAFKAGLEEGRKENRDAEVQKLKQQLKHYKEYHDNMEKTLYEPEKLADLIGGL